METASAHLTYDVLVLCGSNLTTMTAPEYIQILIDGPLCFPEHLNVSSQNLMLMLLGNSLLHSFTRDQLHQHFSRT